MASQNGRCMALNAKTRTAPEGDHLAVGEVGQAGGAEDQGQAHGGEGEQQAEAQAGHQPVEQVLAEVLLLDDDAFAEGEDHREV